LTRAREFIESASNLAQFFMAKNDTIEVEGTIKETLPQSKFLIELTTEGFEGHELEARLSGKMRMYFIRIVPGDKVKVVVSPYDLEKGRITYRYK